MKEKLGVTGKMDIHRGIEKLLITQTEQSNVRKRKC
jgi:hypothetical protein